MLDSFGSVLEGEVVDRDVRRACQCERDRQCGGGEFEHMGFREDIVS